MFRWMGRTLASLVGIVLTNYGLWIFVINITGALAGTVYDPWWILPAILLAGVFAATGGVLFVLSFLARSVPHETCACLGCRPHDPRVAAANRFDCDTPGRDPDDGSNPLCHIPLERSRETGHIRVMSRRLILGPNLGS